MSKRGRPFLEPKNPLTEVVKVRLSRADVQEIRRRAGMEKLSTFLRGEIRARMARWRPG